MGLLQKACETYDAMAHRVGTVYAEEKEPLAPVSHIMVRAQIEITLNQDGHFVTARTVDKEERKLLSRSRRTRQAEPVPPAPIPCAINWDMWPPMTPKSILSM